MSYGLTKLRKISHLDSKITDKTIALGIARTINPRFFSLVVGRSSIAPRQIIPRNRMSDGLEKNASANTMLTMQRVLKVATLNISSQAARYAAKKTGVSFQGM